MDKLATVKGCNVNQFCKLCKNQEETALPLTAIYLFSQLVWQKIAGWEWDYN
jgi:hypothetical protein